MSLKLLEPETAEQVYTRAWRKAYRPDPLMTVSEWADQYRKLSSRALGRAWAVAHPPGALPERDHGLPFAVVADRARGVHEGRPDRRDRSRE